MYEPKSKLVYCALCQCVSDSRTDQCPCGQAGALVPLGYFVDPDPFLGKITLTLVESFTVKPKSEPSFYRPPVERRFALSKH